MLSGKKLVSLKIQILRYSWMDTASYFLIRALVYCIYFANIVCEEYNRVAPIAIPTF